MGTAAGSGAGVELVVIDIVVRTVAHGEAALEVHGSEGVLHRLLRIEDEFGCRW